MRKGIGRTLRIGISRAGIALALTGGWMGRPADFLCDRPLPEGESFSVNGIAALLAGALAEYKCAGRIAMIVLADDLARLFMVTPPRNATRIRDCEAAAAMRFQSLYGELTGNWLLRADWDAVQPFLACALPRALLHAIYEVVKEQRLTLLEAVPRFIASWNSKRARLTDDAWFGVADEDALTLGVIERHRLCAIRKITIPAEGRQHARWLPEQINREALRLNLQMPQRLLLCGHFPIHESNESTGPLACVHLDAAQHAPGRNPGRYALACSGMRA